MSVLPILRRELRVQSRRPNTHWTRLAIAALGVLVCLPFLLDPIPLARTSGKTLFDALVAAGFVLSCAACVVSADSVSRERREGTLELLLITRVRKLDLMLGKLGSAGLLALWALVAVSPVLILPVLAGGVTGGEAVRKGLGLANTLLLALAVGLNVAANQDRIGIAARNAILTLLIIVLLPLWPRAVAGMPWKLVGMLSPVTALLAGGDVAYTKSGFASEYWMSLIVVQGLTWSLLAGAAQRLSKASLDRQPAKTPPQVLPLSPEAAEENARRWKRDNAGQNPIAWRISHQRGIRAAFWSAAILATFGQNWGLLLVYNLARPTSAWSLVFGQVSSLATGLISGALMAWGVSKFFIDSRRSGELELLLTTPAGSGDIIAAQWSTLKRLLLGPLLLMILPSLFGGFSRNLPYALFGMVNVCLSTLAIAWVGLFFGFTARGQAAAIANTVLLTRVAPYVLFLILWFVTLRLARPLTGFGSYLLYSTLQLSAGVLFYSYLIRWAKRQLKTRLCHGVQSRMGNQNLAGQIKVIADWVEKARRWPSPGG